MTPFGWSPVLVAGLTVSALAIVLGVVAVADPDRTRLAPHRRRPPTTAAERLAVLITGMDRLIARPVLVKRVEILDRAGVRTSRAVVALGVAAGTVAAGVLGVLISGPLLGLVAGSLVPISARIVLGVRAGRRKTAFTAQLEDALQLLTSSLRAGHSFTQALATVARDSAEPSREEFTRVLNETRVGREVDHALTEVAARMGSADLGWVAEAIAINREVGGNLASILDRVIETIRERNQIRRQIAALSAEGRLSAYVLMALPLGIVAFLSVVSPEYLAGFTESPLGYVLIGVSVVMLGLGALWLRKIVTITF